MKREEKRKLKYLESQRKEAGSILASESKKKKPDSSTVALYERQLSKLDHKIHCEKSRLEKNKSKGK